MKQRMLHHWQKKARRFSTTLFSVLFASVFLAGCAARLSPQYDQQIADDLSALTRQTMEVLTRVKGGTGYADYAKREELYMSTLVSAEALKMRLLARPVPSNRVIKKVTDRANKLLQSRGLPPLSSGTPSAVAVEEIITTIQKMNDVDKSQGLTTVEVKAFEGGITLSLDQAMTYEYHLDR